jgi:hypothetical protein
LAYAAVSLSMMLLRRWRRLWWRLSSASR